MRLVSLLFTALVACGSGCADRSGPDPFADGQGGQGGETGAAGEPEPGGDGGPPDPTLGGPCVDDEQCGDPHDCTLDRCDRELGRCRHEPGDAVCDDGVYCNGAESCDPSLGCRPAAVLTCSDSDTCTIDVCVEETQSCRHEPRDADGDGDPAKACGGGDCRDDDPLVSGEASERCANQRDDDCDGEIDEADCVAPSHDRCSDALLIDAPGTYLLELAGAADDYALSCAEEVDAAALRDVVVAIEVPDGEPRDVDVVVSAPAGSLVLATRERCTEASSESACVSAAEVRSEGSVARLLSRSREPGLLPLLIAGSAETELTVRVAMRAPTPPPENETCGSARELVEGVVEAASLVGIGVDLETECGAATGELVYFFELDEPRDVRLRAASLDALGEPVVSLRNGACSALSDELTCRTASPSELFARALDPGRYTVGLSGTGPSDVELVFETAPPSEPPEDEGCESPPELTPGVTEAVTLFDHVDAVRIACLTGAPDAARTLELDVRSDVMVLATASEDDRSAASILRSPCTSPSQLLSCASWSGEPVRAVARGVEPGGVRALVETASGAPATMTAFHRPARAPVLVHLAEDCEGALSIPETGGRFEGNTTNAHADYDASCDYGGQVRGGAPEQFLKLALASARRVVFDLGESDYDTLLVVRRASDCPGPEVERACVPGYVTHRSFLDLELGAGEYWVQIDGYNGARGRWVLDVWSAER